MNEGQLIRRWNAAFAAAGAIVGAVAALLLAIIAVARSIAGNAQRAYIAAGAIHDNTCSIWHLDDTNAAASQILAEVQGIEQSAEQVAHTLEQKA